MKRLIQHVNSKPDHIRHLTAIGCTVVVGGIVLGFWAQSFQKQTYALLNPEEAGVETEGRNLATGDDTSLFSAIGAAFSQMKAQIGGIFNGEVDIQTNTETKTNNEPAMPHPLPVSDDR